MNQAARWIRRLNSEDHYVRFRAAEALCQLGKIAVPALAEALKDGNTGARSGAAKVLGKIGDVRAVPALVEALKHEDWWTSSCAAEALGKIGDASAVPALVEALKHKKEWNSYVSHTGPHAEALVQIGDTRAIPALVEVYDLRSSMAEALVQIGDASAVPVLVEALKHQYSSVRICAVAALGKIGEPAIPALAEALKDVEWRVCFRVAEALGKIGDARAVPALIDVLKHGYWDVRPITAEALGKIGDARAVPALIDVLQTRLENEVLRYRAAEALGRIALCDPVQELRMAVPALRRLSRRWHFMVEIYREALQQIESATASWKDLPLPSGPAPLSAKDLPLPAQQPQPSVETLPLPALPPQQETESLPIPASRDHANAAHQEASSSPPGWRQRLRQALRRER